MRSPFEHILLDHLKGKLRKVNAYLKCIPEEVPRKERRRKGYAVREFYSWILTGPEIGVARRKKSYWVRFLSIMKAFFWPSYSHMAIYGFPGTGKTTLQRLLSIKDFIATLDTDDVARFTFGEKAHRHAFWLVDEHIRKARLNEMSFRMLSVVYGDRKPIVFTNFNHPLFHAILERFGYTVIALRITEKQWDIQLVKREGKKAEKIWPESPFRDWFRGMNGAIDDGSFGDIRTDQHGVRRLLSTGKGSIRSRLEQYSIQGYVRKTLEKHGEVVIFGEPHNGDNDFELFCGYEPAIDPDYLRDKVRRICGRLYYYSDDFGPIPILPPQMRYRRHFYRLLDVIAFYERGENPSNGEPYAQEVYGCVRDRCHPDFLCIYVFHNLPNPELPLWYNSQTIFARLGSMVMRHIMRTGSVQFKDIRRFTILHMCKQFNWECRLLSDTNVIASVTFPSKTHMVRRGHYMLLPVAGKTMYLAPSGHIINLLLNSHITLIDWKRYMDTVEENVITYSGYVSAEAVRTHSLGIWAERGSMFPLFNNKNLLWHNYIEWVIGVWAYVFQIRAIHGSRISPFIPYILLRLRRMAETYPGFHEDSGEVRARLGKNFASYRILDIK